MSFVGPGDVVTYLYWIEQVQKLRLDDTSPPGEKECRMRQESGEYILKVYDGEWKKCNRDADLLNGQTPDFYINANNLTGTVVRARLGALWRDTTSNQTYSPYFQSGENTIPIGSGSETINFDNAYSQTPRVTFSSDNPALGQRESVSTTGFQVKKHSTFSYTIHWTAIGRKD